MSATPAIFWRTTAVVFALILGMLSASPSSSQSINFTSSGPGNFHDPLNWSPNGVPASPDTATVVHNMWFASPITVQSLSLVGTVTLEGTSPLNTVEATTVNVDPNATLRGFDTMSPNAGGSLTIQSQVSGTLTVQNDGTIRGGHPHGNLFITDGHGDSSCSTGSSILSNGGTFQGGNLDGDVFMVAGTVNLNSAIVQGGSGAAPVNILGISQAGNVYISGLTLTFNGATTILSGSNTTPGGQPGSLGIIALSCGPNPTVTLGPGTFVNLGTGNGGCLRIFSAGVSTILGTLGTPSTNCGFWDPPDLVLSGNGNVSAKNLTVAGDSFTASGLTGPGINASQSLNIILSPGGVLDLRRLEPGEPYFRGGEGITVCADEILMERGVSLEELMEPAPRLCRGQYVLQLALTPATHQKLEPGQSFDMVLQATNIGSGTGDAEVTLSDSAGWLVGGPQAVAQTLDPGESILFPITIQVPAEPFTELTKLRFEGNLAGQSIEKEISVFFIY